MGRKVKYDKRKETLFFHKSIAEQIGMESLNASGLAKHRNVYSLFYTFRHKGNIKGAFKVLRFYDIHFQLLHDRKEDAWFLGIIGKYEDCAQAETDLYVLEADIAKNLPQGMEIIPMDLTKRLSLLHRMSMLDKGYINTDCYTKEGDWINEILMKQIKEKRECLCNEMDGCDKMRRIFYAQNEKGVEQASERDDVSYVMFDIASIKDKGIKLFMNSHYLDLEESKYDIEKKSPALHQALFNDEDRAFQEDKRLFTMMGVYFVQESEGEGFKNSFDEENINGCEGFQKKMYQAMLPNGNAQFHQMRIYESSALEKMIDSL